MNVMEHVEGSISLDYFPRSMILSKDGFCITFFKLGIDLKIISHHLLCELGNPRVAAIEVGKLGNMAAIAAILDDIVS